MIGSSATPTKLTNISSAMGRRPVTAAPTAAPMKPISQIGVSMMRPGPNCWISPLVAPIGPPQASMMPWSARPAPPATSSPRRMTVGSRSISWRIASFSARLKSRSRATGRSAPRVDVGGQLGGGRRRALLGELDRGLDAGLGLLVDPAELGLRQRVVLPDHAFEALDAVARAVVRLLLGRA